MKFNFLNLFRSKAKIEANKAVLAAKIETDRLQAKAITDNLRWSVPVTKTNMLKYIDIYVSNHNEKSINDIIYKYVGDYIECAICKVPTNEVDMKECCLCQCKNKFCPKCQTIIGREKYSRDRSRQECGKCRTGGGGFTQLIANGYGFEHRCLTGNPQITFFKLIYRRHKSFAMTATDHVFKNVINFGETHRVKIDTYEDNYLSNTYIKIKLPNVTVPKNSQFSWIKEVGHFLLKRATIILESGHVLDSYCSTWASINSALNLSPGKKSGYDILIGNIPHTTIATEREELHKGTTLYVPLKFFFTKCHENVFRHKNMTLEIEFEEFEKLATKESKWSSLNYQLRDTILIANEITESSILKKTSYIFEHIETQEHKIQENSQMEIIPLLSRGAIKDITWVIQEEGENTTNFLNDDRTTPLTGSRFVLNDVPLWKNNKNGLFNTLEHHRASKNIPTNGINRYSFMLKNKPRSVIEIFNTLHYRQVKDKDDFKLILDLDRHKLKPNSVVKIFVTKVNKLIDETGRTLL